MQEDTSTRRVSITRLILAPALISLLVTLLRLFGELNRWSERWFSPETQGIIPSGMSWLVGISWLPVPFGIYFAIKLSAAGEGPPSRLRAVALALAGVAFVIATLFFVRPMIPVGFPHLLIFIWLFMAAGAAIQAFAWPALFKTLLAYGMAARVPVVIVMFLAMQGDWGTHYDYIGMPEPFQMPLWPKFFWLAFFPQLIFWVGFTILLGSLSGSIAALFLGRRASEPRAARA